ncbi:hypothetical protein [Nocardioides zhouii]|uniref:Uncharacterized protein n=1 Tax=Nocardioides zhouii TaxID=1168729 RepID=A0A4Q2T0S2_9ACTN|nr:hypothetical protein [Nocardioides zhouii]RYC10490.1 hypothetical protein EUA94_13270 [Nocardioides zhouii]
MHTLLTEKHDQGERMTTTSRESLVARVALGIAVGSLMVAGVASPAHAATTSRTASCSIGGFTGYMRVTFDAPNFFSTTVRRVEYRINKGTNSGGNNADVSWLDYGVAPTLEATTTTAIQDNAWHTLRETDYGRGSGGIGTLMIFDKSGASDPRCSPQF